MEFYGVPPIGQKQRRPMDGAPCIRLVDIPGPQKRGTGGTLIRIKSFQDRGHPPGSGQIRKSKTSGAKAHVYFAALTAPVRLRSGQALKSSPFKTTPQLELFRNL
jgi:hypothetical protein